MQQQFSQNPAIFLLICWTAVASSSPIVIGSGDKIKPSEVIIIGSASKEDELWSPTANDQLQAATIATELFIIVEEKDDGILIINETKSVASSSVATTSDRPTSTIKEMAPRKRATWSSPTSETTISLGLSGCITVDEVMVNGIEVTWMELSNGSYELHQHVESITEQQLIKIFLYARIPFENVTVESLNHAGGIPPKIRANFTAGLSIPVSVSADLNEMQAVINEQIKAAVVELEQSGAFKEAFGDSKITIHIESIFEVKTVQVGETATDQHGLGSGSIAAIAACCVVGVSLLAGIVEFTRYKLHRRRPLSLNESDIENSTSEMSDMSPVAFVENSSYPSTSTLSQQIK